MILSNVLNRIKEASLKYFGRSLADCEEAVERLEEESVNNFTDIGSDIEEVGKQLEELQVRLHERESHSKFKECITCHFANMFSVLKNCLAQMFVSSFGSLAHLFAHSFNSSFYTLFAQLCSTIHLFARSLFPSSVPSVERSCARSLDRSFQGSK